MATPAPRPGRPESSRQASDAPPASQSMPTLSYKLNGELFTIDFNEYTAEDSGRLRNATGLSLLKHLELFEDEADIDLLCNLAWLEATRRNPKLKLSTFRSGISYTDVEFVGLDDDDADADDGDGVVVGLDPTSSEGD